MLKLQITQTQERAYEVGIAAGVLRPFTVEFDYPGTTAIEEMTVAGEVEGEEAAAEEVAVVFDPQDCTPLNPVYLRWVNTQAGYEYYMFHGRNTYSEEVERGESYELAEALSDQEATRAVGQLPPAYSQVVECGAENLEEWEWKMLAGIARSPLVERWNTELRKWEQVTVGDSSQSWDSDSSRGEVSLELTLLKQFIQY